MSAGKLYGNSNNPRVNKPRIAAKLSGVTIDFEPETFKMGETNKSSEYLSKFPLGQVPSFETKDGICLTESNAIAFHLANIKENNPLLGKNKNELSKIQQYMFFSEAQFIFPVITLLMLKYKYIPYYEGIEKQAFERLDLALVYLENEIKDKEYLVGDALTLADIIMGENLAFAFCMILDEEHRKKSPKVLKYFNNYRELAEVKEIAGETKLCDTKFKVETSN